MNLLPWRLKYRHPLVTVLALASLGLPAVALASIRGADPQLTRAPYLTDPTTSSVQVTWATSTQSRGILRYGTAGNCTANAVQSVTSGAPFTVNGVSEYQNNVTIRGLSASATYCYRVSTAGGTDLLGTNPSPQFTTLDPPNGTAPFTFAVLGDWGDAASNGVDDGTLNANQAGVDAQIAASGARFALSAGDVGYPNGSQLNYGDLNQVTVPGSAATYVSGVFGPSYWTVPGQSVPLYSVSGNHGQNSNGLRIFPEDATVAASAGRYQMWPYSSIDGINPASYPDTYYAFSTGGVRFYLLDASWADGNVGTATGGTCGSHCAMYQVDRDAHWAPGRAGNEYAWLASDLAAHPGGLKIAVFHFPLRSDDQTQPNDAYLQNAPGSTGSVEQLLHDNGVRLAFNGHAHTYQRNVAPPGGVISYVSGGGGAPSTVVSHCASTDAYAIGWSNSSQSGSACGAAKKPLTNAAVYHFLKVTVGGSTVQVTPVDSQGNTFDSQTYNFGPDTTPPSAPGTLRATLSTSTKAKLTWSAATDNVGVHAYDIYRNGSYLDTTSLVTTYTDATVIAGAGYDYRVVARDLAGNTASATASVNGGGATDTTPPSTPGSFTATGAGATAVNLSWAASTDNVGIDSYAILRGGTPIASVPASATSYTDSGLTPGTAYTYQVAARDVSGNMSPPARPVNVTTVADTRPPSTPGVPVAITVTAAQVALTWTASTDDVGVLRYDILRDGAVVGTATGNTFTDTTVAPGTAYSYAVRAYDAAGNGSESGSAWVTTQVGGSVFHDGFESGDLSQWNPSPAPTVAAQRSIVHTGTYAARETSTGSATYAYETLSSSGTELWAQAWVYVVTRSTSANLFGFRTNGGASIVNVYLDTSGRLSVRNNIGGVTTYGTSTVPAGGWHRVVLHAVVNGSGSSIDVSLDGQGAGLNLTGQNLGTNPIARLQLGETATGRSYDIVMDDVTVSPSSL